MKATIDLMRVLRDNFNLDEIQTLNFLMGAKNFSDVTVVPHTLGQAAQDTVTYYERRGNIPRLLALILKERPHLKGWLDDIAARYNVELKEEPVITPPIPAPRPRLDELESISNDIQDVVRALRDIVLRLNDLRAQEFAAQEVRRE